MAAGPARAGRCPRTDAADMLNRRLKQAAGGILECRFKKDLHQMRKEGLKCLLHPRW